MTADERIKKLLDRAGYHPIRFRNTEESEMTKQAGLMDNVNNIISTQYNGDIFTYIQHLVDTIDDLENALESVLA